MSPREQTHKSVRLGYFAPEFPGQTHIFFWREIARLESLGADVRIVSTREPHQKITSHNWSEEAKRRTTYLLSSLGLLSVLSLLFHGLTFSWKRWARVFKATAESGLGLRGKGELALYALFGARLSRLALKEGWTHLHAHSAANAANIALFANLLSDLPYSLTLHGPLSDYGTNQKAKWSHAKFGIVITQKLFDEMRSELGQEVAQKLAIAPMGVNLSVFKRDTPYTPWLPGTQAQLYSVGRLNICKGHDHLIQAVKILKDEGLPIHLRIAGEDEKGGNGYHRELDALIKKLGLESDVTLLGAVSETAVRRGLEESHIFTLASLHEPLGVAIMEAMALEMPVVVTGSGGVKELVDDGVDGRLVEPSNPSGLALSLKEPLFNADACRTLAKHSRPKIERDFSDTKSAEVLLSQIFN